MLSASTLDALSGMPDVDNSSSPVSETVQKSAAHSDRGGPRFDVTQFGAVGDGATDDTAAIQAAFDACWANGTGVQPYGGVVEIPGNHSYLISKTIKIYDSCRVEGTVGAVLGNGTNSPPEIRWHGPAYGATASLTGFTVSRNVTTISFVRNPSAGDTVTVNGVAISFVASGASGNQVNIGGSGEATATALSKMLNASIEANIRRGRPFTNPSAGVVAGKYQISGLNGVAETLATSNPGAIRVATPLYPANSPPNGRAYPYEWVATIQATNTFSVGDWVYLSGLSTRAGMTLNNLVSEVVAASGSSFTIPLPIAFVPDAISYSDTGTATSIAVDMATDSFARYEQDFKDFQVVGGDVGIYAGSRMDTGSHIENVWVENAKYFGFYLPMGATNFDFSRGWRADSPGIAGIYARGADLSLSDGQTYGGTGQHGAGIMLDNQGCNGSGGASRLTLRHVAFEAGANFSPGLGAITLLDCASASYPNQFAIDMEAVNVSADAGVTYAPAIVMSPQNDTALTLSILNGQIGSSSSNPRWIGIPSLIRQDASFSTTPGGNAGFIPILSFSPAFRSMTGINTAYRFQAVPSQCIGDCNIGQLWQYGINASAFLYTDTEYAALPNATTLYAGQILAPPGYWNGANGKRYALDVVYKTGTIGIPNGGHTTCSAPGGTTVLTCSNATDLSVGEMVSIGYNTCRPIQQINAASPSAVLVSLANGNLRTTPNEALTFCAPVLGPEIQLPTKSTAAPAMLAWSQGDMEQNSNAKANGVAAWINVTAGKPGEWAGVPLGNSSGQINSSQIAGTTGSGNVVLAEAPTVNGLSDLGTTTLNNVTIRGNCSGCRGTNLRTAQAWCAGTAAPSSTIALFGAGSATASCTSRVANETVAQPLMTTSGTVSNLAVRCGSSGANASSGAFSVWDLPSGSAMSGADSGVTTGLTVTYGTAKANTTLFDSTHTFKYEKGDLFRIQFTTQARETLGSCEASFNY
jgi:hypothetical protein